MKKDNVIKGRLFEREVAQIYEGLGFRVESNTNIPGQQIDIIVVKEVKGAGEIKFLVECKYISTGNVTNQIVHDFNSFIESEKTKTAFTGGIIVTNKSYSKDAYLAKGKNIQLITINELEATLFGVKNTFRRIVEEYKKEEIFTEFVNLSANTYKKDTFVKKIPDALEYIKELIYNEIYKTYFITILADYGSGKTTLLKKLRYDIANLYLQDETKLKPIYIELKNYNRYSDINLFIASTFNKQFNLDLPQELIWKEINRGGFILLLDGFDEMSQQVNRKIRLNNFLTLSELFATNSISIITCRPSYFVSSEEFDEVIKTAQEKLDFGEIFTKTTEPDHSHNQDKLKKLNYKLQKTFIDNEKYTMDGFLEKTQKTIFLENFNDKQINLYLEKFNDDFLKFCKSDWKEIKSFLLTVYDLNELMKKPILLSMITKTILFEKEDYKKSSINYGSSALYESYTDLNLKVDWQKGETRHFLDIEQRREFAQAIALLIYKNNLPEIVYDDIVRIVRLNKNNLAKINKAIDSYAEEDIIADIQICTFITRSDDNKFKFIHKSFMEYFVARFIKENIKNDIGLELLMENHLPKEILFYLGSFGLIEMAIIRNLHSTIKKIIADENKNNNKRRNVSIALIYSNNEHLKLKLSDALINRIDVKKINFELSEFAKVKFEEVIWRNLHFNDVIFKTVELYNTKFTDVIFSKTLFKDATLIGTTYDDFKGDITFSDCYIDNFNIKTLNMASLFINSKNRRSVLKNGEISVKELEIGIKTEIYDTKILNSTVCFEKTQENCKEKIIITNTTFENCIIESRSLNNENIIFNRCGFVRCTFLGLAYNNNLKNNNFINECVGYLISENIINRTKSNKGNTWDDIYSYFSYLFSKFVIIEKGQIKNIKFYEEIVEPLQDINQEKFNVIKNNFVNNYYPFSLALYHLKLNYFKNLILLKCIINHKFFSDEKLIPSEKILQIDNIIEENMIIRKKTFHSLSILGKTNDDLINLIINSHKKNKKIFFWIITIYSAKPEQNVFPKKTYVNFENMIENFFNSLNNKEQDKLVDKIEENIVNIRQEDFQKNTFFQKIELSVRNLIASCIDSYIDKKK